MTSIASNSTHRQLVQIQQLGLLNTDIQNILENYMPNDETSLKLAKLSVDAANDIVANFKPSISDQIKVGFYSTDRFTQTIETDILPLKAATDTLDQLCNEIEQIKYDLKFATNSSKHQFECELQNRTIEIYGKMTEKFLQLKRQQDETIERIRHAYRSQLANALKKVGKFAQEQSNQAVKQAKLKSSTKVDEDKFIGRIKELQRTIIEHEGTIEELRSQIRDGHERSKAQNEALMMQMKDERARAVEESMNMSKKVARLQEGLAIKEEETEKLLAEVASLQLQIEKEKILNEQLKKELKEAHSKGEAELQKIKKEFEKQKMQLETKMHEKIKESRNQLLNASKQEITMQEQESQRKKKEFEDHERQLKEKLAMTKRSRG